MKLETHTEAQISEDRKSWSVNVHDQLLTTDYTLDNPVIAIGQTVNVSTLQFTDGNV